MRGIYCALVLMGLVTLSACAPVNTEFSCNETAGDRCLSIEEVNAMTELKEAREGQMKHQATSPKARNRINQKKTQTIWVAPWKDAQGNMHQNDTLFASIDVDRATI